jgi:hypothetical protein
MTFFLRGSACAHPLANVHLGQKSTIAAPGTVVDDKSRYTHHPIPHKRFDARRIESRKLIVKA